MFKFFRAPKLDGLSFLDWSNRVVITLRDSKSEVEKSNLEDTFDNILSVFIHKAHDLLNGFDRVTLKVNKHGIYVLNSYTEEEIYVLEFTTRGKVAGLPINNDFSKVSAYNHILGLLGSNYKHRLAKLRSQQERLESELSEVVNGISVVNSHLEFLSSKSKTQNRPEYKIQIDTAPPQVEVKVKKKTTTSKAKSVKK